MATLIESAGGEIFFAAGNGTLLAVECAVQSKLLKMDDLVSAETR